MALSHQSVCQCRHNLSTDICIMYWSHRGSGVGTSCRITIFYFLCLYMKYSLSLPGLCEIYGHPSTGHAVDVNKIVKDSTYVSVPSLPISTHWICLMNLL